MSLQETIKTALNQHVTADCFDEVVDQIEPSTADGSDWHKPAVVFIPDLHWLSQEAEQRYDYTFNKSLGKPCARATLFRDLCAALTQVTHSASVVQLGDILDTWREAGPGTAVESVVGEMLTSNPWHALSPLLRETKGKILLGNHDRRDEDSIRPAMGNHGVLVKSHSDTLFQNRVLVLHGDLVDPIERLPDWLQYLAIQVGGEHFPETQYRLGPHAPVGQHVRELRKRVGRLAWELRQGNEDAFDTLQLKQADYGSLRFVVIGHTHHAGIQNVQIDGGHICVVDCGAWLEACHWANQVMPSAQIGVASVEGAQCTVRLYQLSPH